MLSNATLRLRTLRTVMMRPCLVRNFAADRHVVVAEPLLRQVDRDLATVVLRYLLASLALTLTNFMPLGGNTSQSAHRVTNQVRLDANRLTDDRGRTGSASSASSASVACVTLAAIHAIPALGTVRAVDTVLTVSASLTLLLPRSPGVTLVT